jgi:hypothetical protein
LTITTDDVAINGTITTGTNMIKMDSSTNDRTIALGGGPGSLAFGAPELKFIATTGMTVGGGWSTTYLVDWVHRGAGIFNSPSGQSGSQTVNGVLAADSDTISGVLTLLVTKDDSTVTFTGTSSTFNAIAVQADNGIMVQADANTVLGVLYLDADVDDSSTEDDINQILLADTMNVISETLLTMESTTGMGVTGFVRAATLTLKGGSGVVILDSLTSTAKASDLVINSDYESHGDGTLSLQTTKTIISNDSDVTMTVWDLDLDGTLTAGTAAITLHG